MDKGYRRLSLLLYEVLEVIGISEGIRHAFREWAITQEILSTTVQRFVQSSEIAFYLFGSLSEGTTTLGLDSDIDLMGTSDTPVVENICEVQQHGESILMIRDDTTPPGYVKLQIVKEGVPQTKDIAEPYPGDEHVDHIGRICFLHLAHVWACASFNERNGPAVSRTGKEIAKDADLVLAFRCRIIPSFARSWLSRKGVHNWLSQEHLYKLKESGCFFVGVNHPLSQNVPIEWRLSFSLQERTLMFNLNTTQHKCYVLLKMIKKDIIHRKVPKSISSYHCKTCLFYAAENTPAEFWTRENILECTRFCIKLLLRWVKEQICPNYFIPTENMFDRLEYNTLKHVEAVLANILKDWCTSILSLVSDDVGKILFDVLFGFGFDLVNACKTRCSEVTVKKKRVIVLHLLKERYVILESSTNMSNERILFLLLKLDQHLQETEYVTEHSVTETKTAFGYFSPYVHLHIAQCLASLLLNTRDDSQILNTLQLFKHFVDKGRYCDLMSAYLISASYCYQTNQFYGCEQFLKKCVDSFKTYVVSECACFERLLIRNETLEYIFTTETLSTHQFITFCTAACLIFLPCQANLVPPVLHYEMFRSMYQQRDLGSNSSWFDWIVVDSVVYLHFLQYMLYLKTYNDVLRKNAVDSLSHVIHTDDYIGHRETAYNLLGWIYNQENKNSLAMKCFIASLRIRPKHNAAKWHILVLLYCYKTRLGAL